MRLSIRVSIPLLLVAAVAASCGKTDTTTTSPTTSGSGATSTAAAGGTTATTKASTGTTRATGSSTPSGTATASSPQAVAVKLGTSSLGEILVDGDGKTLYLFKKDTGSTSACTGACTNAWPPLLGSSVTPGAGLDSGDFATITRDDGTTQITFYGHPLYRYAADETAGETTGQGLNGNWYVVSKSGQPVES